MCQTINGWTKQKMIDHIKANFKGKSYLQFTGSSGNGCRYRTEDGRKCAVGLFIPDELYVEEMERMTACAVLRERHALANVMPLYSYDMAEFQSIHDDSEPDDTLQDMLDWIEKNVVDKLKEDT